VRTAQLNGWAVLSTAFFYRVFVGKPDPHERTDGLCPQDVQLVELVRREHEARRVRIREARTRERVVDVYLGATGLVTELAGVRVIDDADREPEGAVM
jgi:hypothetical protein